MRRRLAGHLLAVADEVPVEHDLYSHRRASRADPPGAPLMKEAFTFLLGLALALVFAAAAVSAVVLTYVTVQDAVLSFGSLDEFEARVRHYSDRLEADEEGLRLVRSPHPIALHFGMLALAWIVVIACATALRSLQRSFGRRSVARTNCRLR